MVFVTIDAFVGTPFSVIVFQSAISFGIPSLVLLQRVHRPSLVQFDRFPRQLSDRPPPARHDRHGVLVHRVQRLAATH